MKPRLATVALIGLCMLPLGSAPAHSSAQPEARSSATNSLKMASDYGNLPISFQPNRGQFEADTTFGSRGFGYALSINSTGLRLQLRDGAEAKAATVEMKLLGANPDSHVRGTRPLSGEANYFSGPRENWITHVPTYEKVQVENVYPGIDAVYYGNQDRLEYDFIVAPGASPHAINIAFPGSTNLAVADNGDLLISTANHTVRESKPLVYQDIDGNRVAIASKYALRNSQQVGFEVADYDPGTPLVIDPQLIYSTFGESMTRPYGIALDSAGNAYICGTTYDGGPNDQATNAYVEKLNGAGSALWFASFGAFGLSDSATAIAVDASGNAYVTGWTVYSAPPFFPKLPTVNAIQPNPGGGSDAFVTKFDTNGNMVYSTYLGGSGDDQAEGIAVDSLGSVFVTGHTGSTNFPTAKPLQSMLRGSLSSFVTVLNPQGTAFIYSTYIGGSGADAGTAIAVDAMGNAYVTGSTSSLDFPTANPIRSTAAGGLDTFILKLNPAGSAFMYSTYLGGHGDDVAKGIAIDPSNNAYVTGRTNSANFPTASAFQATLHGGVDAFVTKINASGTAFSYSTYLGGANDETTGGEWCEEKTHLWRNCR